MYVIESTRRFDLIYLDESDNWLSISKKVNEFIDERKKELDNVEGHECLIHDIDFVPWEFSSKYRNRLFPSILKIKYDVTYKKNDKIDSKSLA